MGSHAGALRGRRAYLIRGMERAGSEGASRRSAFNPAVVGGAAGVRDVRDVRRVCGESLRSPATEPVLLLTKQRV